MNNDEMKLRVIARLRCDFPTKFGVPRQSGLAPALRGTVVFEPEFRVAEALRGIEGFSHLWLIWGFSMAVRHGAAGDEEGSGGGERSGDPDWSPTVRPPRLGGNVRMGVFATRSPFRPNSLGLSLVQLEGVENDGENGLVLRVLGADLVDGTPIYDIKPYLVSADCREDAVSGFTDSVPREVLEVVIPREFEGAFPADRLPALRQVLAQDPRPAYQHDPERVYGFGFAGHEIKFRVSSDGILTVTDIQ